MTCTFCGPARHVICKERFGIKLNCIMHCINKGCIIFKKVELEDLKANCFTKELSPKTLFIPISRLRIFRYCDCRSRTQNMVFINIFYGMRRLTATCKQKVLLRFRIFFGLHHPYRQHDGIAGVVKLVSIDIKSQLTLFGKEIKTRMPAAACQSLLIRNLIKIQKKIVKQSSYIFASCSYFVLYVSIARVSIV